RADAAPGSWPNSLLARRWRSRSQHWSSETFTAWRRRRSSSVATPAASRSQSSCSSATSCSIVPCICPSSIWNGSFVGELGLGQVCRFHGMRFPNESDGYRAARDALLQEEIELRRHSEAVAE